MNLLLCINGLIDNYEDRLDYLEIRDFENLAEITEIQRKALAAGAIYIGQTRLIDNIILNPEKV